MRVSPTEPPLIKTLGEVSQEPEQYGVDILWRSRLGTVGVQRKQFPGDFLSSVYDGRLNKEFAQMRSLDLAVLLLEGREQFTTEGKLISDFGGHKWTQDQHNNYLASVQLRGVHVHHTTNSQATVQTVRSLEMWSNKTDHSGLDYRNAVPRPDLWERTPEDTQLYVLQGFPDTGPKRARAVMDSVGFPFRLTVPYEVLREIPGIGDVWINKLKRVMGDE